MSGTYNTNERLKLPDDKHETERRRLEELSRSTAFLAIREKLEAELAREQSDLERASGENFRYHQGAIHGLRVALNLPDTMYQQAGGKRQLFGAERALKASPLIRFLEIVPASGDPKYICEKHGTFVIPKSALASVELGENFTVACLRCANEGLYE